MCMHAVYEWWATCDLVVTVTLRGLHACCAVCSSGMLPCQQGALAENASSFKAVKVNAGSSMRQFVLVYVRVIWCDETQCSGERARRPNVFSISDKLFLWLGLHFCFQSQSYDSLFEYHCWGAVEYRRMSVILVSATHRFTVRPSSAVHGWGHIHLHIWAVRQIFICNVHRKSHWKCFLLCSPPLSSLPFNKKCASFEF